MEAEEAAIEKYPFCFLRFTHLLGVIQLMNSVEHPCGVCGSEVVDNAVQCDGQCQLWHHCSCIGMSSSDYENLTTESDALWECPGCKGGFAGFNTVDAVDVVHFDFQKNLPTPKLTVGDQFYKRLLWTFLFGVYTASSQIMVAYMWNELVAKRGANDDISCLAHFIFQTPLGRSGAKWSIWWCDNCPGQNKNNCLIWFFQELIQRKVYSRVDFKFLVPGHTYGPTDRNFALIEKYAGRLEHVYVPEQWYKHVHDAVTSPGSKIQVVEMKQSDFRDYQNHLGKTYTERNEDMDKQRLNFCSAVWFNFGKGEKYLDGDLVQLEHPQEVWVRHTYDVKENPQTVSYVKKRGAEFNTELLPPTLYHQYPLPINSAKAKDVQELADKYVPRPYWIFYTNLPVTDD